MLILKGIKTDCTHNQSHFQSFIPSSGVNYHSFDLSNATDRMPLALQRRVIERVIGRERSDAWASMMVDIPFSVSGRDHFVKYSAGQPMGAYSS